MKDYTIKKVSSLKSRLSRKKVNNKEVDINSNNADDSTDKDKEFRDRIRSMPVERESMTDNTSPTIKQIAHAVSSKLHKVPERIHGYKLFKILMLGAPGVGKSSILKQFVNGKFTDAYLPTMSEIYETGIFLKCDDKLKQFDLEFHDFNGIIKEEYPDLYEDEILNCDGCIVVYSKDKPKSVDQAIEMVVDIKNLKNSNTTILLSENKADLCLTCSTAITRENFHLEGCIPVSLSAKTNEEIETSISSLIRAIESKDKKM